MQNTIFYCNSSEVLQFQILKANHPQIFFFFLV